MFLFAQIVSEKMFTSFTNTFLPKLVAKSLGLSLFQAKLERIASA